MKPLMIKLLFLLNHIGVLFYVCRALSAGTHPGGSEAAAMSLSSLLLADIAYISLRNIKGSRVLTLFCGLLALDNWYILFAPDDRAAYSPLFLLLGPAILFLSARFLLYFLFQGSGYRFRKTGDILLALFPVASVVGLLISRRAYGLLYALQFAGTFAVLLFLLILHRSRVLFVLKSEKRPLLLSSGITLCLFALYSLFLRDLPGALENFGIYLPVLLFSLSVHGIAMKEKSPAPPAALLSRKQQILLASAALFLCATAAMLAGTGFKGFIVLVDLFTCMVFLVCICLEQNLRKRSSFSLSDPYSSALEQLRSEEKLKEEFSDYLHDDILQDLHSVRNLLSRADRPEIRELASDTLDCLNLQIREQMQDYHPVMRPGLTARENYGLMIGSVSRSFPDRRIHIRFDCPDDLFLVAPYDLLVFRILKELLTNVYKHSSGDRARISLSQEKSMIRLSVSDNGSAASPAAPPDPTSASPSGQKGLASIQDQVASLGGSVTISQGTPAGFEVMILLPMKGENSYEHFTG